MTMIPKVIHYCWFGHNPLPELAVKCIESWKKFLPNYEIKEWNESNFDVNMIPYTKEAYEAKKYAFVSDYARFWILYKYGGLYFDTDVEVVKTLDDLVTKGAFMGAEKDTDGVNLPAIAPGLGLGVEKGHSLYKQIVDLYSTLHFLTDDHQMNLKTVVDYTSEFLSERGLKPISGIQCIDGIYMYPSEYFCPINTTTKRLHVTKNTRTIHHYAASWMDEEESVIIKTLRKILPESFLIAYNKWKNR